MRRKSDSYLNATQILKVAGFDKPQRTRVLEREVQKGEHEKVQGGYGKYQGQHFVSRIERRISGPAQLTLRHVDPDRTWPGPIQAIRRGRLAPTHHRLRPHIRLPSTCAQTRRRTTNQSQKRTRRRKGRKRHCHPLQTGTQLARRSSGPPFECTTSKEAAAGQYA